MAVWKDGKRRKPAEKAKKKQPDRHRSDCVELFSDGFSTRSMESESRIGLSSFHGLIPTLLDHLDLVLDIEILFDAFIDQSL